MPEDAPCTMKMQHDRARRWRPACAGWRCRRCLSVTVITSVDTRLNAATATISVRMMPISRLLDLHGRRTSCGVGAGPVAARARSVAEPLRTGRLATSARVVHVGFSRSCTPVGAAGAVELGGVVERGQRQAAVVLVVADRRTVPTTVERASGAAAMPAGVTCAPGRTMTVTWSPTCDAERPGQLGAQHDVPAARRTSLASVVSLSWRAAEPSSLMVRLFVRARCRARPMPRTPSPCAKQRLLGGVGSGGADHLRAAAATSAFFASDCQSARASPFSSIS